ncbi:MAG: nuclear transport factor 2 family protein [Bacteroidota bacterium]
MKVIFLILISVTVSSAVVSCVSESETSDQQKKELKSTLEQFNQAFLIADADKLSDMLTDSYLHCNSGAEVVGKERWLNYIRSRKESLEKGDLAIQTYEMSDLHISVYDNAAAVNMQIEVKGINEGEPFTSRFRATHTWIFESGRWKRASFHDTKL